MKRNEIKGNVEVRARFIGAVGKPRSRYIALMKRHGLRHRSTMTYIAEMTQDQVDRLCSEIGTFIAENEADFAVDVLDVTFNGTIVCSVERDEPATLAA